MYSKHVCRINDLLVRVFSHTLDDACMIVNSHDYGL